MPLVFGHPNVTSRSHGNTHEAVPRDDFERQFHAFTSGIFADWEPSLWSNVLVAGGAVLASLLPVDPNFPRLKPASSYLDYDFYFRRLRRTDVSSPPQKLDTFMREVLWPHSDVDLFVYGLKEQEAQAKLLAIASSLRRTLLKRHGMDTDVCFVKTPNTLTINSGILSRSVQIITRLYASRDDILNGFDIDCCCCGFDGEHALITPRAIAAITTRVNTVDLSIRGESYELRLLKYVERGFAIGVPRLVRAKLSDSYLQHRVENDEIFGGTTLSDDGWDRWGNASCLAKLIMAENLAVATTGVLTGLFASRKKKNISADEEQPPLQFRMKPQFPRDTYPGAPLGPGPQKSARTGTTLWPATTRLDAIKHGEGEWAIKWLEGNMPRKPQSWEEWSKDAYEGQKGSNRFDAEAWRLKREEREKVEEQKKKTEAEQAKAKRVKDLEQARAEGAELAVAQTRAAEAAAEVAQAKAVAIDAEVERLRSLNEKELLEQALIEEELSNWGDVLEATLQNDDSKLCSVCLDQEKSIMLEPCRHVCLCQECAPRVTNCPICRCTPTNRVQLYL